MTYQEYVDVFSSLLTPTIAIIAVYIAWQQYRISHNSLNNQIYERRHMVFLAFMSFFADIMRDGKTTFQRCSQFYSEASESEFLFEDNISEKREELYSKGLDLALLHEKLYPSDGDKGLPVGDERSEVAHEATELLKWFGKQIVLTKDLFKSQMRVQ